MRGTEAAQLTPKQREALRHTTVANRETESPPEEPVDEGAYRCCICGGPVNYTFWACRDCQTVYGLRGDDYRDWPEWAKMLKNSEKRRRGFGQHFNLAYDDLRWYLRYAPYENAEDNKTYRKSSGVPEEPEKEEPRQRYVMASNLLYSQGGGGGPEYDIGDDVGEYLDNEEAHRWGGAFVALGVTGRDGGIEIKDAIERLHPRYRRCLELLTEGYTQDEIGSKLGVTRQTIWRWLGAIRQSG